MSDEEKQSGNSNLGGFKESPSEYRFGGSSEGVQVYDEKNQKPSSATDAIGEIVDRDERKRLKALKKAEKEATAKALKDAKDAEKKPEEDVEEKPKKEKKQKKPIDPLEAALKKGRMGILKKNLIKKRAMIGGLIAFIAFIFYAYSEMTRIPTVGRAYGACRTYLELKVRYPENLEYISLRRRGMTQRLWYIRIDPFGARRLEEIRCIFKRDENSGRFLLSTVAIERREEPSNKIDDFNRVLPAIWSQIPRYEIPRMTSDKDLSNIKVNRAKVRGARI
tara:strand:- start:658 stop:1491 length:834 start_codon:yes stop_codon:yes gene_type:complete